MATKLQQIVVCGRVVRKNRAVSFTYNDKRCFVRVKSTNKNMMGGNFLNTYNIRERTIKSYSVGKIQDLVIHS